MFLVYCAAAFGAVGFGAVVLLALGAPIKAILINALAALFGWALSALARPTARHLPIGAAAVVLGGLILATAFSGAYAHGASRWLRVGALSLQPSFVALPALVILFAHQPGRLTGFGVALAAAGLALQPDRAMAFALLVSVTAAWRIGAGPINIAAIAAALIGVAAARPDVVPPVQFVEGVVADAFAQGSGPAAAAVVAFALLLAPFFVGRGHIDPVRRAFGAFWASAIAASMIVATPTPFLGASASPILGYFLGVALLAGLSPSSRACRADAAGRQAAPSGR